MKNKFSKLMGIIASIAVIVCTLTACSFEEKEKTVTFSLNKKDNYSFTITVEGAKWKNFTYDTYKVGSLVDFDVTFIHPVDEGLNLYIAYPVTNWKRTSDTVITATFVSGYTTTAIRRMGIEFRFPDGSYFGFRGPASELIVGGDFWDNYRINSAKSSIVWE